jgi:selenocysteine lyase/cysteine desulfurase
VGALYGRYELLDRLRAYKVRPTDDVPPHKFETGTKNYEGLAGTTAAINYLAAIRAYERPLSEQLELCREAGLPVVTVMSGGYGR